MSLSEASWQLPVDGAELQWPGVITSVARRGPQRSALLVVDQEHPFFFDHPLDHVPGMQLVTGLLELVRASGDPRLGVRGARGGSRIRLEVNFTKICETDRRVVLFAEPKTADSGTAWDVRAVQDEHTVCAGSVELVRDDRPRPAWAPPAGAVTPIDPQLVHRSDPRNVVLGEPAVTDERYEVPLISPPSGHFLLRHDERRYGVEEIVESGRQFLTALSHVAHGRDRDARMLWLTLSADLPTEPVRSVPLALRWPVSPARGNTATFDYTVLAGGTAHALGSLHYVIKCVSPAVYRRLREGRR
jgi:A-factor biosynthesis hotdog domain